MARLTYSTTLLATLFAGIAASAWAKEGAFYPIELDARAGLDFQNYSEKVQHSKGALATDYSALVPSAKTDIKLFFSPQTFLYFTGMGTLYTQSQKETWKLNGSTAQTNQLEATRTSFSLQLGQRLAKRHDLSVGLGFDKNTFVRSKFALTALGESTFPYTQSDGTAVDTTDAAAMNAARASLYSATVREEMLAVNFVSAYQYSTFFENNGTGLRYKFSGQFSTPLYFRVTNIPTTLTSQFDGYDIHTSAMLGWQMDKQWLIHAGLHGYYEKRNKIISANATLPNSELFGLEAQIGFSTRF
ncbi:hypothetical protein SAMN02745127_02124 [Oceanospirillum multiglobuliferum]|uniref:Outer membrane protein beta-barrel domain-containing protein n=1 Tax=Oceanospirillum multiglobuliferum TaxID=64969 RepID=A0A1T4R3H7_9GAMM|nr:hypothetical protein [Oceanospirillum multiglobuliferum]OPX55274.1 hypothetical protein BTE48_10110 [Oceanospirillum multiglobuliferum]SKA10385.1 hypothetical protein SAMN02745127_02124 [Oceanospirillum multiglobuliferum]